MNKHLISKTVLRGIALAIGTIILFGTPSTQAAEKEIVWAVIDDFSGPYSAIGQEGHNGIILFLEENGGKVGPFKVKLVTRDSELKPAVGVRRLQEVLVEEKPVAVFSGNSSAVQLAIADIIGKTRSPLFWTEGWDTKLTGANGNRYTFRYASPNYTIARASTAAFLDRNPGIKKVICLMLDYSWGYDLMEHTEFVLKQRNIQIIKKQFIPVTATDASVFMTEAKHSGADAYVLGIYGNLFAIGLRQAHEFGLKNVMKVLSITGTLNLLRGVGCEAIEGFWLADHWNHAIGNKWSKEFTEKYKKRFNVIPADFAAARYLTCQIMDKVMKQTGSADPKVLIPALENFGEFDGPTGKELMAGWYHQIEHKFLLERGKACKEKKYDDDFVEVLGGAMVYPKQGEKGFEFDRRKEPL
jgi:branched-chain amino acid transport system substrate-binding protein